MAKKKATKASDKKTQKNFRVEEQFKNSLDDWCETNGYDSTMVMKAGIYLMSSLDHDSRSFFFSIMNEWKACGFIMDPASLFKGWEGNVGFPMLRTSPCRINGRVTSMSMIGSWISPRAEDIDIVVMSKSCSTLSRLHKEEVELYRKVRRFYEGLKDDDSRSENLIDHYVGFNPQEVEAHHQSIIEAAADTDVNEIKPSAEILEENKDKKPKQAGS